MSRRSVRGAYGTFLPENTSAKSEAKAYPFKTNEGITQDSANAVTGTSTEN